MNETYTQKRYRIDSDFREKQLKYSIQYAKENPEKVAKAARIRYAKRTPKQIKARKEYLIKLRSKK